MSISELQTLILLLLPGMLFSVIILLTFAAGG
jgi:hypothetical protein